ncbi:MAG: hypothetical protein P8R42_07775 [Candidatus Binatia bacterium]|nr:hypothetical protein [Candidatus Binatia bacterium]
MKAHAQKKARIAAVFALVAGLVSGLPGAAEAQRESGIQLAPESNRYFITKDVGSDRWAITYDLDTKTVSGNVFPTDGGAPTFLSCNITDVQQADAPADAQYFMDCRGSGPCAEAPCDNQWDPPFAVGPIPGSFLLPTNTKATYAGNVQPIYNRSCATSAVCHGNGAQYVILARDVSYGNTFLVDSNGTNGPQGDFIKPFDPALSYVFTKIDGTGAGSPMPFNGSPLDAEKQALIRNWILEGAANN